MKKLIIAAVAAAGLASGLVLAQASNPEFTGVQNGVTHPEYGPQTRREILNNSGADPDKLRQPYRSGYGLHRDFRGERDHSGVPFATRITRNDRDGDGVRNSRDRYPDDPRYR